MKQKLYFICSGIICVGALMVLPGIIVPILLVLSVPLAVVFILIGIGKVIRYYFLQMRADYRKYWVIHR